MKNRWQTLPFLALLLLLVMNKSFAKDQDDATKASAEIISSLRDGQYSKLWDSQISDFFKSKLTRQSFLANFTIGRAQLGKPVGSPKLIDTAYSKLDPATGIKGDIYSFNYSSSYETGDFYERIVVIKENDGKFRMAGLWGAPAPK